MEIKDSPPTRVEAKLYDIIFKADTFYGKLFDVILHILILIRIAVVITLTTVGYSDIVSVTALGKVIASFIMLLGYSIIAIPTGIVSAEISRGRAKNILTEVCLACGDSEHIEGATFCRNCGNHL